MTVEATIGPGATLGVLGGGQLGRMFVHAAQRLGFRCVVLDPDPMAPAGLVAEQHLRAGYVDAVALDQLAAQAQAITTEFENVPSEALRALAAVRPVAPGAEAVAICQDRALEKAHFERSRVPCAPYAVLQSPDDVAAVPRRLLPGILKTCTLGYDGKGQRNVRDAVELAQAWQALGGVRCVLEQRLRLAHEISVVLARSHHGQIVSYPPLQNLHRDGILAVTQWPAPDVTPALQAQATEAAAAIADSLGYVGVLCVEFFVLEDGTLCANEMAPRPHNSGHCTIDASDCSQFELQVRAMAGLPLMPPRRHSPAVMLNLLGDLWGAGGAAPPWHDVLSLPGAHLHLYGKRDARPGRKMGHLTITAASPVEAASAAREAARRLGLPTF